MSKINEKFLLTPTLKLIQGNPGCDTAFLKKELEKQLYFSPEDLVLLENRKDTKYTQIIRNLCSSHYGSKNEFSKYVVRMLKDDGRHYKFYLNDKGSKFILNESYDEINNDLAEKDDDDKTYKSVPYYYENEICNANDRKPLLDQTNIENHRYCTDPKLSKTALEKCGYTCEYATLIGETHHTFNAGKGHKYIEAHHLIPMKAQKDFKDKNLDRTENIVGLCPNCHKAVHYGTLEEKVKVLSVIYKDRIGKLRNCSHHIDISFDDLINMYY